MPLPPVAISAAPPVDRFRLVGRTRPLDRRTHAIRSDIADVALAGLIFAPHYAGAHLYHCTAPAAMLRAAPSDSATAVSQILFGEGFAVIDASAGWAWGYCVQDRYVGYIAEAALGTIEPAPTHRVTASRAPIFSGADIKSPVAGSLSIGARVAGAAAGDFVAIGGGFLHRRHVAGVDELADAVTVAERLIGLPYLWGGRGAGGIDCSGLVQLALAMAGIDAPRDSDMQRVLGREIAADEPLQRGDLIFFPGHVGIMADEARLLHANAYWMGVVAEPLADVVARGAEIAARRRL